MNRRSIKPSDQAKRSNTSEAQDSSSIFQTIFEQSPVSTQIFSLDGKTIRVNKAWEKMWNLKFSDIKDYNILKDKQLVREGVMPYIKKGFQGKTIHIPPNKYIASETIPSLKGRDFKWTKGLIYPVKDKTGEIKEIVLMHEDITDQMIAEERLKASEERYRTFIAQSNEGIWRFELDEPIDISLPAKKQIKLIFKHAYLAECNESMARMYGFKNTSEIVGARLHELMIESDERNIAYLTAFIQSGYRLTNVESHEKDKDGNDKYFSNSLVGTVVDGKVIRAWGTQADITAQKKAEDDLKHSRDQLSIILQGVADGISMQDVSGKLVFINEAGARISGFRSAKDMLQNDISARINEYELIDEEGGPFSVDNLPGRRALRGEKNPETVIGYRDRKTHEARWSIVKSRPILDEKKKIKFAINIFHDITASRTAEKLIENERNRFKVFTDFAPVGIFQTNVEGECLFVNKRWCEMAGLSSKEAMGQGWAKALHPEDKERVFKEWSESARNLGEFFSVYRFITSQGKVTWVQGNAIGLFDDDGNLNGYLGAVIDITDRKNVERQKDEFIAVASHELKTPVTSLKVYAQVLHKRFASSGDARSADLISKMDTQFNKLTNLISDLLDVTKIETGKLQFQYDWFDFNELVCEVVEEMQRTTDNHTIVTKLEKTRSVRGDRDRVSQVLINFISNAIKYSPRAKDIIVSTKIDKQVITASVQDFGVGITKEEQEQIFGRFYRAKGTEQITFPGLGLGLYICSEIIKRHNGKIWVESEPKKGSIFSFSLPLKKVK